MTVVHASNRLAMTTLRMVKGSHAKRTVEFVKACLTFNEITIPSINSVLARSNLFLETAEVRKQCVLLTWSKQDYCLLRSGGSRFVVRNDWTASVDGTNACFSACNSQVTGHSLV